MGAEPRALVPTLMGWLGAFSSVALVAGLGLWVYDLATRDARSVPVVRAMEGPTRVAPDEPGGFEAAHQGYSVNGIASEKSGPPLADRVVLAPAADGPVASDLPMGSAEAAPPPDPAAALRSAVEGALSEVLGMPAPDEANPAAAPDAGSEEGAANDTQVPPRRPRTAAVTRGAAGADPAPLAPGAARSLDPRKIAAGAQLVQLGAFDSRAEADEAWADLSAAFSDFLATHPKVVEAYAAGGRTTYRLRAYGFDNLAAARNFCSVLVTERVDCIPVVAD